jgi:hypothetical protein
MTTDDAASPGRNVVLLEPGQPARRPAARALWCAVLTGVVFSVWAYFTTQDHPVVAALPWRDDPYHGVVSFTEFLVPVMTALLLVRTALWRRGRPVPAFRVNQTTRAGLVIASLVGLTVLTDALATALHADRQLWTSATPWLVLTLVRLAALAVGTLFLGRTALRALPQPAGGRPDRDWLDDLGELVRLVLRWRVDRPLEAVREHIVVAAVLLSLVAGLAVTTLQAVGEGGEAAFFFTISVIVVAGGFLAFCLICNAVLHIAVPRARPVRQPGAHRVRTATRVGAIAWALALPGAAVLRDQIWSLLGHQQAVDSVGTYAGITLITSTLVGILVFAGVMVFHRRESGTRSVTAQ